MQKDYVHSSLRDYLVDAQENFWQDGIALKGCLRKGLISDYKEIRALEEEFDVDIKIDDVYYFFGSEFFTITVKRAT